MNKQDIDRYLASPWHCPVCGDRSIDTRYAPIVEENTATQVAFCLQCGSEWLDIYTITDFKMIINTKSKRGDA